MDAVNLRLRCVQLKGLHNLWKIVSLSFEAGDDVWVRGMTQMPFGDRRSSTIDSWAKWLVNV